MCNCWPVCSIAYLCVYCRGNNGNHPFKKGAVCSACRSGHGWCEDGLCSRGKSFSFALNTHFSILLDKNSHSNVRVTSVTKNSLYNLNV